MELMIESVDPPPHVRRMWIEWTSGLYGDLRPRVLARYVDPLGYIDTLSMVWQWHGPREVRSEVYCPKRMPYKCKLLSDLTGAQIDVSSRAGKRVILETKHFIALVRYKGIGRELANWYLSNLALSHPLKRKKEVMD